MLDLEEAVESLSAAEITLLNTLQDMEVGVGPTCVCAHVRTTWRTLIGPIRSLCAARTLQSLGDDLEVQLKTMETTHADRGEDYKASSLQKDVGNDTRGP